MSSTSPTASSQGLPPRRESLLFNRPMSSVSPFVNKLVATSSSPTSAAQPQPQQQQDPMVASRRAPLPPINTASLPSRPPLSDQSRLSRIANGRNSMFGGPKSAPAGGPAVPAVVLHPPAEEEEGPISLHPMPKPNIPLPPAPHRGSIISLARPLSFSSPASTSSSLPLESPTSEIGPRNVWGGMSQSFGQPPPKFKRGPARNSMMGGRVVMPKRKEDVVREHRQRMSMRIEAEAEWRRYAESERGGSLNEDNQESLFDDTEQPSRSYLPRRSSTEPTASRLVVADEPLERDKDGASAAAQGIFPMPPNRPNITDNGTFDSPESASSPGLPAVASPSASPAAAVVQNAVVAEKSKVDIVSSAEGGDEVQPQAPAPAQARPSAPEPAPAPVPIPAPAPVQSSAPPPVTESVPVSAPAAPTTKPAAKPEPVIKKQRSLKNLFSSSKTLKSSKAPPVPTLPKEIKSSKKYASNKAPVGINAAAAKLVVTSAAPTAGLTSASTALSEALPQAPMSSSPGQAASSETHRKSRHDSHPSTPSKASHSLPPSRSQSAGGIRGLGKKFSLTNMSGAFKRARRDSASSSTPSTGSGSRETEATDVPAVPAVPAVYKQEKKIDAVATPVVHETKAESTETVQRAPAPQTTVVTVTTEAGHSETPAAPFLARDNDGEQALVCASPVGTTSVPSSRPVSIVASLRSVPVTEGFAAASQRANIPPPIQTHEPREHGAEIRSIVGVVQHRAGEIVHVARSPSKSSFQGVVLGRVVSGSLDSIKSHANTQGDDAAVETVHSPSLPAGQVEQGEQQAQSPSITIDTSTGRGRSESQTSQSEGFGMFDSANSMESMSRSSSDTSCPTEMAPTTPQMDGTDTMPMPKVVAASGDETETDNGHREEEIEEIGADGETLAQGAKTIDSDGVLGNRPSMNESYPRLPFGPSLATKHAPVAILRLFRSGPMKAKAEAEDKAAAFKDATDDASSTLSEGGDDEQDETRGEREHSMPGEFPSCTTSSSSYSSLAEGVKLKSLHFDSLGLDFGKAKNGVVEHVPEVPAITVHA